MIVAVLSVAVLGLVQGQFFTDFHPAQSDIVHVPRSNPQSSNFQLSSHRLSENFRVPQAIDQRPLFHESTFSQRGIGGPRAFLDRNPHFIQSGGIVEQTRAFAESGKALFKFLENNDQAQLTFDITFETSECLGNVGDVIELMDETVKLVEDNAPEIKYIEAIVENLKDEKDIIEQMLGSSKMLRALGYLIPPLTNLSPKLCLSSPEDSIRSFKSLSNALINIKNHRDIIIDETVRQHLDYSSKVMSDTATFLIRLNTALRHFKKKCENHEMKDAAVYDTIADIMEILADLFDVLGFKDKAVDIRKQAVFVKRITRPFEDLDGLAHFNTTLTCHFEQGSYEELGLALDDIRELVKSVGIKKLSEDLGIDFELGLIHEV